MTILHLDIETYSEADLKRVGLYRYSEDFTTEILVVCYAFDDQQVRVWMPQPLVNADIFPDGISWQNGLCPESIVEHIRKGGIVAAHNAQFERVMLNALGGSLGVPYIAASQTRCTAAKAAATGIPRRLGEAAKALGTHPKDDTGYVNMLHMAKPRSGKDKRYTMAEYPNRWRDLIAYCADDVRAEREIDDRLPDLSDAEQRVYELDQAINDRGVRVDLESVGHVRALIAEYKAELEAACRTICGYEPTQTGKLAEWIRTHGYPQLPDLQAASVIAALADPACPENVRAVLRLRTIHAMKAVAKYEVMAEAVSAGDRLRGMLLYHGAGTGRWSSQIVQLQNLYRPAIKDADVAIEAFAARDLQWIKDLYPVEPMKVFASCVRGMLVPEDGKEFIALDYAGIENRILPWVCGEEWKIKAFEASDAGAGPDLYKLAYARAFGIPHEKVTDGQRQVGKVMELSMGYEGGVAAFVTMSKTYRLDLQALTAMAMPAVPGEILHEAERAWQWAFESNRDQTLPKDVYLVCDSLKRLWRASHPQVVRTWRDVKDAAVSAVRRPGAVFTIPSGKIAFKKHDEWLWMRLPSGRKLAYYQPVVEEDDRGYVLTYMGVDTKTRRWMRVPTYGGRLAENFTQAIARDVLVSGMFALTQNGYPLVLTVHDELVAEVRQGFGSVEDAVRLACVRPEWAAGLPLAAVGWRGRRYRK